jgi:hypothetical protein
MVTSTRTVVNNYYYRAIVEVSYPHSVSIYYALLLGATSICGCIYIFLCMTFFVWSDGTTLTVFHS